MKYLLDTDILILLMRGLKIRTARNESQRERVRQARRILQACRSHANGGHQICCSAVTLAELEFGARNSDDYETEMTFTRLIMAAFDSMDFSATTCPEPYGRVRHHLSKQGKLIGENDLIIAAHALALDAIMVTNNVDEFSRVPGLRIENWAGGLKN